MQTGGRYEETLGAVLRSVRIDGCQDFEATMLKFSLKFGWNASIHSPLGTTASGGIAEKIQSARTQQNLLLDE